MERDDEVEVQAAAEAAQGVSAAPADAASPVAPAVPVTPVAAAAAAVAAQAAAAKPKAARRAKPARTADKPVKVAAPAVAAAKEAKEAEAKEVKAGKPAKAAKARKGDEPARDDKAPSKAKLVRDSFTMPQLDFALIAQLKDRALGFKRPAKKSELLRAGLHALAALDDARLQAALDALAPVKAGRPKKG